MGWDVSEVLGGNVCLVEEDVLYFVRFNPGTFFSFLLLIFNSFVSPGVSRFYHGILADRVDFLQRTSGHSPYEYHDKKKKKVLVSYLM